MPITLGCPSCGKRFRARDESAGKKVKCPYCQAAVQVPTSDEAASASAPTAPLPPPDSGSMPAPAPRPVPASRPAPPPTPAASRSGSPPPAAVASPDDWGAIPSGPAAAAPPAAPASQPLELEPAASLPGARGAKEKGKDKDAAKPARGDKGEKAKGKPKEKAEEKTPEQVLAAGWLSVRRGLFWIQFALFWLSLIGFAGFGKAVYTRTVGDLPKGDGTEWVSIEGYINSNTPNAVQLSKTELLNLLLYGVPVFLASVPIVFGRLIASGAPRSSGARGLYALSALFALVGFAALFGWFIFSSLKMKDEEKYFFYGFILLLPLAEFWFLHALTASGVALKRPKTARAVGMIGFMFALAAFAATLGWDLYLANGRPKQPDVEIKTVEQAGFLLGWLFLIAVYSRAVRNVRLGAKKFIQNVEDGESEDKG
jgi:hypothetical protein